MVVVTLSLLCRMPGCLECSAQVQDLPLSSRKLEALDSAKPFRGTPGEQGQVLGSVIPGAQTASQDEGVGVGRARGGFEGFDQGWGFWGLQT